MAEPPPNRPPPTSPNRTDNDAVASANNAPHSPPSPPSVRYDRRVAATLSYGVANPYNKRIASTDRIVEGVSSPPKSRVNRQRTPSRLIPPIHQGGGVAVTPSYPQLFDNPSDVTPPPSNIVSPQLSADSLQIITALKAKPSTRKVAILPVPPAKKKAAAKLPKVPPKKKATIVKVPQKKKVVGAPPASILTSSFFNYLRPATFDGGIKEFTELEMVAHDWDFNRQLMFRFDAKRKQQNAAAVRGRGLRSSVLVDLDSNDDAHHVRTTNFKQLSRYVLEDLLACDEDKPLLLCIARSLDDDYNDLLSDAAMEQGLCRGGDPEICRISGKEYYCIKVTMDQARKHQELISGAMQGDALHKLFDKSEGFTVRLDDTSGDLKLTFAWKDIISQADDIMFFGTLFDSTRPFAPIFAMKRTKSYIHQVFRQFAIEYRGDANASAQLYAAYPKRIVEVQTEQIRVMPAEIRKETIKQIAEVTKSQKVFINCEGVDHCIDVGAKPTVVCCETI